MSPALIRLMKSIAISSGCEFPFMESPGAGPKLKTQLNLTNRLKCSTRPKHSSRATRLRCAEWRFGRAELTYLVPAAKLNLPAQNAQRTRPNRNRRCDRSQRRHPRAEDASAAGRGFARLAHSSCRDGNRPAAFRGRIGNFFGRCEAIAFANSRRGFQEDRCDSEQRCWCGDRFGQL